MRDTNIDLGGIDLGAGYYVVRAETAVGSPFGRLVITRNGTELEYGLRFDLDKRIILDTIDDPLAQEQLNQTADGLLERIRTAAQGQGSRFLF